MSGESKFRVNLEDFEGPLDILYFIVKKNKFDIKNLPLVLVVDQYLEYMTRIKEHNLANDSYYMLLAAKLIRLKTNMLLPGMDKNEFVESVQREIEELIEFHEHIQQIVESLDNREKLFWNYFISWKAQSGVIENYNHDLMDLVRAIERIMERGKVEPAQRYIDSDALDIRGRLILLIDYFKEHGRSLFRNLLSTTPSIREILEVFLALLELLKRNAIKVYQDGIDGEIVIMATQKIHHCQGVGEVTI